MMMKQLPIASLAFTLLLAAPLQAQISSDGTLSTTVTTQDALNFLIENGDRAGGNLFHSFQEFSIPTGGEAYFNNAADIVNIFSRVTGGNISNIDGIFRVNGTANLFLINPAGIIFGENASLNIGGSFFATTAESVVFSDGLEFSATNPEATPLLSVNIPVGLQMGVNSGGIEVQGTGYTVVTERPFFIANPANLQVNSGNTLALVGSEVTLDGGIIAAQSGRIELGSALEGVVSLRETAQGWTLGYESVSSFGDINLLSQALATTAGQGGSSIQVQGRNLRLEDGSRIFMQNQGLIPDRAITVNLSGSLVATGNAIDQDITDGIPGSGLRTETLGVAKGGNIDISVSRIDLNDGASITANSYGIGSGGDIDVNAFESILLQSSSLDFNDPTSISATAFVDGNVGNIEITSPQITLRQGGFAARNFGTAAAGKVTVTSEHLAVLDGGSVSSTTFGSETGGEVIINADLAEVRGILPETLAPSALAASTLGTGDASSLTINAGKLVVRDGGRLDASTNAFGNSGSLTINATESVEVSGTVPGSINPSLISSSSTALDETLQTLLNLPPVPSGNAGSIAINTPVLKVTDGAQVTVRTDGIGDAGTLAINADNIILSQGGSITASTQFGTGGDVQLQVKDTLQLNQLSGIIADALQAGQSGNITITASQTILTQSSSISTNAQGGASGGELNLTSDILSLSGGSILSAVTNGSGKAGNILIQAQEIDISGVGNPQNSNIGLISNPSLIAVNTLPGSTGEAGSISINTNGIRISEGGLIAASTTGSGDSGDVNIFASESVEVTGISNFPTPFFGFETNHPSRISANSFTEAAAGSVRIKTPILSVSDSALVEVNGLGEGGAGNLEITSSQILLDNNASLQALVAGGNQGNITLNTDDLILSNNSTISTNASNSASGGNIDINTNFIFVRENSNVSANAVFGVGGNISINTETIFVAPDSRITASSQLGVDGNVNISNPEVETNGELIELPNQVSDSSEQIATGCTNSNQSQFIATGRGGIPATPNDRLSSDRTWQDLRDVSAFLSQEQITQKPIQETSPVIEAAGWIINSQGKVELVAKTGNHTNTIMAASCSGNNHL